MKTLLCLVVFFAFVQAQNPEELIGVWQAESHGVTILQTIAAEGTYTFEVPSQNYFEEGTWQFDGTNFSQQWQDPRTGAAQQATYRLEFFGVDSIQMSGGNLNGEVYSFTRMNAGTTAQITPTNPLSASTATSTTTALSITLLDKNTLIKLPPPEAGEYGCSHAYMTIGITPDPTGSLGSTMTTRGVGLMESLVGNLVIDGNGNYKMTESQGEGGTYSFDSSTNKLSFAGELGPFPIKYFVSDGKFTIRLIFLDENNQEETSLDCTLFSDNAVTPTTATPNPGLPGTLGLHASEGQIISVVAESGELQIIGSGMQPYQAANGETIVVSRDGMFGDVPEFTILASDGTLAARLEIDDSEDCISKENIFGIGCASATEAAEPVLSDDGTLIAYSSVDNVGSQSVIVRGRSGSSSEVIAVIPDMSQPAWTPDGGLLMAGGARATGSLSNVEGIFRTDSSFSELQPIGNTLVSPEAPVLSPDGKTIAFRQDNTLWLVNSDGSSPRAVLQQLNLNVYGYPAWSPDSQWLAIAAAEPDFESWSWLLVLPVNGNSREAQQLVLPSLDPLNVSRDSRITWR